MAVLDGRGRQPVIQPLEIQGCFMQELRAL